MQPVKTTRKAIQSKPYVMDEAVPPNIQELAKQQTANMQNRPINLARIEQEWKTTNPENKALPINIQNIVMQRIANSPNML